MEEQDGLRSAGLLPLCLAYLRDFWGNAEAAVAERAFLLTKQKYFPVTTSPDSKDGIENVPAGVNNNKGFCLHPSPEITAAHLRLVDRLGKEMCCSLA